MDIGPISAIRPVAQVRPTPGGPDLSRVFEVEYLGQSRDDQYSAARKASRGLEDEEEEAAAEELTDSEVTPDKALVSRKISFFA